MKTMKRMKEDGKVSMQKKILAYLVLTIMYLGGVAFVPEINI